MEPEEIHLRFAIAWTAFQQAEQDLIRVNPSERSLTHRLAVHLEAQFRGWAVDCEYNRVGHRPKEIVNHAPDMVNTDSEDAVTVFPDIIVHRRGEAGPNLLVIEAKKATSTRDRAFDLIKLKAYLREHRYVCAGFVVLPAGDRQGRPAEWIQADV
jgi:hypothetical protein